MLLTEFLHHLAVATEKNGGRVPDSLANLVISDKPVTPKTRRTKQDVDQEEKRFINAIVKKTLYGVKHT